MAEVAGFEPTNTGVKALRLHRLATPLCYAPLAEAHDLRCKALPVLFRAVKLSETWTSALCGMVT